MITQQVKSGKEPVAVSGFSEDEAREPSRRERIYIGCPY
jgi:hypothetical protein